MTSQDHVMFCVRVGGNMWLEFVTFLYGGSKLWGSKSNLLMNERKIENSNSTLFWYCYVSVCARTNMFDRSPYKVSTSGSKLHNSNLLKLVTSGSELHNHNPWSLVTSGTKLHDSNFMPLVPERIRSIVVLIIGWHPVFWDPNCVTPSFGHAPSCWLKAFPFIQIRFENVE